MTQTFETPYEEALWLLSMDACLPAKDDADNSMVSLEPVSDIVSSSGESS